MKKIFFTILFSISFLTNINAAELKFGWNIGKINMYYEAINNTFDGDCEIGHFNWLFANKFSIGFDLFGLYDMTGIPRYSILPLEIAFVPLNYKNMIFASIYGKTGFELIDNRKTDNGKLKNSFFGLIGINTFIFAEMKIHYSPYLSVFIEYNTHNELKMGMGVDLSYLIYYSSLNFKDQTEKNMRTVSMRRQ